MKSDKRFSITTSTGTRKSRGRLAAGRQGHGRYHGRASCPNNLIEDAIRRLFELRGISVQQLLRAGPGLRS